MNLEEIITAAVEKQVNELVTTALTRSSNNWGDVIPSSIDYKIKALISCIAEDEVKKHEAIIRDAIKLTLANAPTMFEISANTRIVFPKPPL